MANKEMKSSLDGMYSFLSAAYSCNWQHRWKDTPFMEKSAQEGKQEPVSGHVWGTMGIWFHLRRACPSLNSVTDSTEVYEILLNHDVGESQVGDTSLYNKMHGLQDDKQVERTTLEGLSSGLSDSGEELLGWFDEFEAEVVKIDNVEIMVAKWIDSLQGNHFGLVFGNDLPENSELINKILQIRFIPYTNRLTDLLSGKREQAASDEVKQVAEHHAKLIKKSGIDFDESTLKL